MSRIMATFEEYDLAVGKDNTLGYFAQVFTTDSEGEEIVVLDQDFCTGWEDAMSHIRRELGDAAYHAIKREVVGV